MELAIGTCVATAWLLSGMDNASTLVSVDNNENVQKVAAKALGHARRLQLVHSGALEFLATQPAECFDLVFADALPGKYEALSDALAVVSPGGFRSPTIYCRKKIGPKGMLQRFRF